ncbi:EAL domain-containing protein [Radiobacillus kanasensis]|uniref:EAL domain-containing protein n=1 Tax=Radiobacillus kanasensis TaxID=2844358 RepID=UPI001E35A304|nr:EAL domain-containing protein [Radiobacillus kanasensis]UFT99318.1 EAL domain-containing protein [Radiobacillus kanasensis]
MMKIGRLPISILIVSTVLFLGWSYLFRGNEWVLSLGVCVLQVIAGVLSFSWLYKAWRNVTNKQRNFWLLLSMGVLFYLFSNLIWLYFQISHRVSYFTDLSYLLWLLAYTFFLAALIYKTKELSRAVSRSSYIFNIIIFMFTVAAISIHYLIQPTIEQLGNSLLFTVTTIAYSVVSLSILFVTTILYYLTLHRREKGVMLYIIVGFSLQVIADWVFGYLSTTGSYQAGNIIDLFWLVSLLLIGFAGYYTKESNTEAKWMMKDVFERKETIFPYVSIVILMVLVQVSYQWNFNALSLGLFVIYLVVIGRQLNILSKYKKLIREYRHLAYHDSLTGLPNRVSFKENLDQIMERNHSKVAILLMDLDRFKVVNDTLGHYIGDKILVETAARLKQTLAMDTPIFRLGGDEFIIILPETTEVQCSKVAETLLTDFQQPFLVNDYGITVTPSIGISIFPEHGTNSEDLLKHADAAMYLAKENGKNGFRFYTNELNESVARKMVIENELLKAIERNQLSLSYQPKVDLYTSQIIGTEALLRWEHPELGQVSPAEFIPIAEETGQIIPIGEWVLRTACRQNKIWEEKGFSPLGISVNVSVRQLQHSGFLNTVKKVLQDTDLNPQCLELEITESIMQNIRESTAILTSLKQMGVKTSIDDFGTGYSSLNILQKLPIDIIKIDKSFIDDIGNTNQQCMIKAIIDLGLNLNLDIVAEGIEHEHQLKVLAENGCSIGQGYLFSKAVKPEEFERMLLQKIS